MSPGRPSRWTAAGPAASSVEGGGESGQSRYSRGSGCEARPRRPCACPRRTPAPGSAHCPSRLRKAQCWSPVPREVVRAGWPRFAGWRDHIPGSASPRSLTCGELASFRGLCPHRDSANGAARPGGIGQLAAGTLAGLGAGGAGGRCMRLAGAPRTGHGKDPSNHSFRFSSAFHAGAPLGRQRMMKSQTKAVQLMWISNELIVLQAKTWQLYLRALHMTSEHVTLRNSCRARRDLLGSADAGESRSFLSYPETARWAGNPAPLYPPVLDE